MPFAMCKFIVQQVSREAVVLHARGMPRPSELGLDEDGFDAGGLQGW